jgi:hypothetical protein
MSYPGFFKQLWEKLRSVLLFPRLRQLPQRCLCPTPKHPLQRKLTLKLSDLDPLYQLAALHSPRWRHDGKELFFISPDARMTAATVSAAGASFEAAPPVALFQTRIVGGGLSAGNKPQYTVSADGRFLINVTAGDSTASPITLLLNWKPPAQ